MKKNIWKPLQITWLFLAIFTAHNSIRALGSNDSYCVGAYCERNEDCGAPCSCDIPNFTCYNLARSGR